MKKLLLPVLLVSLGLGGCVAVPVSGDPYYAPSQVYVAPPAVVVRPTFYGSYYGGSRHYR